MNGEKGAMKFRWNPEISAGAILQAIMVLGAAITLWTTRAVDMAVIKEEQKTLRIEQERQRTVQVDIVKQLKSVSDTQIEMVSFLRARNVPLPKQKKQE